MVMQNVMIGTLFIIVNFTSTKEPTLCLCKPVGVVPCCMRMHEDVSRLCLFHSEARCQCIRLL